MTGEARRGGALHRALDLVYERYNRRRYADPDPIVFLYRYRDPRDREIAALVASSLSFGGVRQIMASVERALSPLGSSPRRYLRRAGSGGLRSGCAGFRHRWAGERDLELLYEGAREAIERYGSLEGCFMAGYDPREHDIVPALERFCAFLIPESGGGPGCLVPLPHRRSACKRLHLFLRWMVRSDRIDPGGWSGIPASKLVVPLDRHMHRFGLELGLTTRRQADLGAAREMTEAFARMEPRDPVKYDFALTRLGIRRDGDRDELLGLLGLEARGISAGVS